jgi:hypothetical protein
VAFNGASQTIPVLTFNNLTVHQSSGSATLGGVATVGGVLTLTSGNVITGANNLYISSTGSVSRTSGHIVGNLRKYITTGATNKNFEIGDSSNYVPVSVAFGSVTVAGDLTMSTTAGDHPNIGSSDIDATKSVNRYWTATNSGITFNNYSATFNFINPGDIDSGADTANFGVGHYSGSAWSYPTVGSKLTTSTQATGMVSFSDFQLGIKKNPVPTTTSINPTSRNTGDPGFTLTVNGTNFVSNSVVNFNGVAKATTFVSASQLTASILASDISSPGSFNVTVFNPTPGGGTSNAQTFTVTTLALSPVTIASNNANTSKAKVGDVVTLSFTSNGTITSPTVAFKSGGVTVANAVTVANPSGNNWTAAYTTSASDTNGLVTFTINFNSAVGTAQTPVTTTTNGSSVTFDKTVPTLTPVSIASNNSFPTKAKVGNIVTLSFTASETIQTPTVVLKSGGVNVTNSPTIANPSGNNWTATYTTSSSDTEGLVSFTINFSDQAGNAGTAVTAVTDASSVTFDKTNPSLTAVSIASSNASPSTANPDDVITLTFTSSETIQTPTVVFKSGGASVAGSVTTTNTTGDTWTASYTANASDTEGAVTFTINFSDQAGNAGTQVTATTDASSVTFSKPAPTLTSVTIASNNANTSYAKVGDTVTLTFTASFAIQTPTVAFKSGDVAITATPTITNTTGNTWTATYIPIQPILKGWSVLRLILVQ